MQTTLLGLAIAFIIALLAALIGPYFIDWNQFRPQFEAEATRIIGAPVRVGGELDARLLPTPTLRLRSVTIGGPNDAGKLGADKLDVEFSLGSLMRGEWRATELTINGMAVDLGLDANGRVDLPAANGTFDLASLAIDRLNLTGRIALHDAASRTTLELNDIAFSGDVRSLAGSIRGDGNFEVSGMRYPFRVSSGQNPDGSGVRVHFSIDPGDRPLSVDAEGLLAFEARVPRFDGAVTLAVPQSKQRMAEAPTPWKIAAKVKADPAKAKLDQIETSYGADETALKLAGGGNIAFGPSPLLRVALSARQLDADRFMNRDKSVPAGVLPSLRSALAAIPQLPIPAQIEFNCEQITLGGRPLTNIAAELRADANSWTFQRLDLRAPGATQMSLNAAATRPGRSEALSGRVALESSEPDALIAWLQGRSEAGFRNQKPLRLNGNVTIAPNHLSIDGLQAEIDGGAVEGRMAFSQAAATKGSRVEAELKGDRLDLDATSTFVRSLAGPQDEWPDEARLSLDIGRAVSLGQELRPLAVKLGYDHNSVVLDQLKFGQPGGLTMEGGGNFDRANLLGRLAFDSTAPSLGQVAAFVRSFSPSLATHLAALDTGSGPARASLVLDLGRNKASNGDSAALRGQFEFELPQIRGHTVVTAAAPAAVLRGANIDALAGIEVGAHAKLFSEREGPLLALLGLDRAVAAGEGPARFEASVNGPWRKPLQVSARISGNGIDADAQGSSEPFAAEPKASINLRVRRADLAPLFGVSSSDSSARNISLSSRVTLAGNRLSFDDLDSSASGSRLRGHLAMTLDHERSVEGEVGLDALDLGPALAVAMGAAGRDAGEPLAAGLVKGWRGKITFQALRGMLPGGGEMRPFSGTLKSDGQSLTLDPIKGGLGGGEVNASIDARESENGRSLNVRAQLSRVDAAALHYHQLAMPKGRVSAQMTLSSQGRSIAALTGALSGNGTVNLDSAEIAGLDPRAFEVAIRAGDSGQPTDEAKLRQLVEPVLSSGSLAVGSVQIPFTIRDGRLRVGATTLEGKTARAVVSGGYDIPADQADIRASLTSTTIGSSNSRPEIQLFAAGPPDRLSRTVDVTSLSSWLAVRAIDRETRRLDAIERGEAPPPATAALPVVPGTAGSHRPPSEVPPAVGDQRRWQMKPKAAPTPQSPAAAAPNPPVAIQQVAPLPPPVEVKPAPVPARPRPRPPLILTPP